jgi:hypothetical protein
VSERDPQARQAAERAAELAATHRDLRAQRAAVGDLSAEVHEQAARVHDELEERSLLDPDELREHAQQDREMAAEERAALAAELDELAPED